MAKRTVSFGDYTPPSYQEYTGDPPPAGRWFDGRAVRAKYLEEDDQVRFIIEIEDGDYAGWGKGWYAPFEGNMKWKMQEILRAIQGIEKDVTLDWDSEAAVAAFLKKGKTFKFLTEEYGGDIKIKTVRPMLQGVPTKGAASPAPSPQDVAPEADDEPVEPYTEEELEALSVDDLLEILADEFEVEDDEMPEKPKRDRDGSKYKALLVDAILDEQDGDEGSPETDGTAVDPDPAEEDADFEDGFEEDPEPEPEPEPAPARRARKASPAKAAPAKAAPAKAAATTRRRRV
jgi:hypothetical protein